MSFVKWDPSAKALCLLNQDEVAYLGNWNGPQLSPSDIAEYPAPDEGIRHLPRHTPDDGCWLIVPEVTHITFQPEPMTLPVIGAGQRSGLRTAFIFYDATPLRRPELTDMADAHAMYMQQLMLADLVLPISHWVSADLSAYLRLALSAKRGPGPHIEALPLPGESHLTPRVRVCEQQQEPSEPYFLSVGSILPHKNQIALVQAFERYCLDNPSTAWRLLLVGNIHGELHAQLMEIIQRNNRIQFLGDVDDEQLVQLYSDAAFTAFPSVIEGFGLPILESLWFGKPCLCADFGAMAEVAHGGGCLGVDTKDAKALFRGMVALIEDRSLREELASQARARHIDTWHGYAGRLKTMLTEQSSSLAHIGVIYYVIDQTAHHEGNTGIQRVTRSLARALLELGAHLVPACWSCERQTLEPASDVDLAHLEKWNGPLRRLWAPWKPLDSSGPFDWMVVAEVTHLQTQQMIDFALSKALRCAWIFHDAIPWKLTDMYPPEASEAHRDYMLALNRAHKVFATSYYTCNDLTSFLTRQAVRVGEIHKRLVSCVLPGEFSGMPRVSEPKVSHQKSPVRILCVGTVEPRKNHERLLKAMHLALLETKVPFEITLVGGAPFADLAERVQLLVDTLPGAQWLKGIGDSELQQLYRSADFTVYPSIEEGFGLPILESLWNAKPCLCGDFGAMREVAEGGGCMMVDVRDVQQIANSICKLVDYPEVLARLGDEAVARQFKTWKEYGKEVLHHLASERHYVADIGTPSAITTPTQLYAQMPNLSRGPLLSICISTFNREAWLSINLKNLVRLLPQPLPEIELLVCDNTSTDNTPEIVQPYLGRSDFRYERNSENVGMLGNLKVTANHARGQYIWILGDDDLVLPGTIERLLDILSTHKGTSLVYLNYAYTRNDKAEEVQDLDKFLGEASPIGPVGPDKAGTVRDMCAMSENFFTAIYCLIFRRDHALRAYSQNTSGQPFSTMLSCIPTTYHVLHHMMDEPAYWMGQPQLVVNLNVSWMKYAPLWILERLPEAFDVAERYGGNPSQIDCWRVNLIPSILHFLNEILDSDPEGNAQHVSLQRLINRFKHLPEFQAAIPSLSSVYLRAQEARHPLATFSADELFASFQ
ncbi:MULTISPECIES: glycosyltransferase [Cyanobium]|uniref:glycosyltransferase n=1 Tax=Cyanobium TaxID=167375 RepID=UPI00137B3A4D|nr:MULTISPECIES: glycosyltransferase [Cyanobium]MCP9780690.1 glycosyltransferase [Cyanobium sp. To12R1]